MMKWLSLLLASAFEVGFTTALRFTDDFRNMPATLGCAASAVCEFLVKDLVYLGVAVLLTGEPLRVWGRGGFSRLSKTSTTTT